MTQEKGFDLAELPLPFALSWKAKRTQAVFSFKTACVQDFFTMRFGRNEMKGDGRRFFLYRTSLWS